ncbi:MAG: hypothetical protein HY731_00320 [Candidatus Tectomicrobia bacterium]|nr:hypothetical protein [Candidatus Tectomicrobia bacterium]
MLLDTSGLFCYHHRDEPQHPDTVTFFNTATTKLTHSYVLAEFVPLCQARGLDRASALSDEALPKTREAMIHITMIQLMLRRLRPT